MRYRTIFIYIVSFVVLTLSIIQWQFLYPDFSQLLFGCGIAFFILGSGYLWEWMDLVMKHIENLNYRIDSIIFPIKELKGGIK